MNSNFKQKPQQPQPSQDKKSACEDAVAEMWEAAFKKPAEGFLPFTAAGLLVA